MNKRKKIHKRSTMIPSHFLLETNRLLKWWAVIPFHFFLFVEHYTAYSSSSSSSLMVFSIFITQSLTFSMERLSIHMNLRSTPIIFLIRKHISSISRITACNLTIFDLVSHCFSYFSCSSIATRIDWTNIIPYRFNEKKNYSWLNRMSRLELSPFSVLDESDFIFSRGP